MLITPDEARRIAASIAQAVPAGADDDDLRIGRLREPQSGVNAASAQGDVAERTILELRKESPYNDPALMMIVKDEARKMVLSLPFFPGC